MTEHDDLRVVLLDDSPSETDSFGAHSRVRQGAGLRVTLRGEDGALLSGQYDLFDRLGNEAYLVLRVDRWASNRHIHPHGTHESTNPLHPGRYRLVLISPGYEERSVTLVLRAGEYEDVDVTLSK